MVSTVSTVSYVFTKSISLMKIKLAYQVVKTALLTDPFNTDNINPPISQGIFVFLFYIVLNDQVKSHWLIKVGLQEEKRTTTSSSAAAAAGKSAATKATTVSTSAAPNQADNIYENAAASNEDHTYASAEYATASDKTGKHEFPAKSDNNANI